MFREMRRKKQVMDKKEAEFLLAKGTSGVLAVNGDDGYPYAVPISYVYEHGRIYFHSAKTGHKLDAILKNEKVSFTVIGQDNVIPEEFTTYFSSVIAFGKARIIEDAEEKMSSLILLSEKYSPNLEKEMNEEIEKSINHLVMVAIDVEHLTGKEAIELVRKK